MNERLKIQGDLREACVAEAMRIIQDVGIEDLSLREVARRLGVSHQAPYRHFPSRDHILAEIVDRCFRGFDAYLARTLLTDDPMADLDAMGRLYLEYAATHPLEYRLMFGARLPDAARHPEMLACGSGAFDQLCAVLGRLHAAPPDSPRGHPRRDVRLVDHPWDRLDLRDRRDGRPRHHARGPGPRRGARARAHPRGAAGGKIGLTRPNRLAPHAQSSEYSRKTRREDQK